MVRHRCLPGSGSGHVLFCRVLGGEQATLKRVRGGVSRVSPGAVPACMAPAVVSTFSTP